MAAAHGQRLPRPRALPPPGALLRQDLRRRLARYYSLPHASFLVVHPPQNGKETKTPKFKLLRKLFFSKALGTYIVISSLLRIGCQGFATSSEIVCPCVVIYKTSMLDAVGLFSGRRLSYLASFGIILDCSALRFLLWIHYYWLVLLHQN